MEVCEIRGELSALVSAFRAHLEGLRRRGTLWIPAGPSPRRVAAAAETQARCDNSPAPGDDAASAPSAAGDQPDEPALRLRQLRETLGSCQRCRLSRERKNLVFGEGGPAAALMFIGEAPGQDEDIQGVPFVGAAGQLLTRMIEAMGLQREEVYIANIIKCRPPQNRDPAPDEVDACEAFLRQQIEIISPRIIIAMGNFAAKTLLRTETGITRLRGRFHTYQGVPLMPTFHPAYLLRNPDAKRPVWQDLKAVMAEMDRLGLARRRS
jgi:uracil-DNA glycosylase